MTTNTMTGIAWIVDHMVSIPSRDAGPRLGQIEARVLQQLSDSGPISLVELAHRLGLTSIRDFVQLRNAVYRLVEKGAIVRAGTEPRRTSSATRIVWGPGRKQ